MSKNFGKSEKVIQEKFSKGNILSFRKKSFEVIRIGKPSPQDSLGECKTDLYIELKNTKNNEILELKISIKMKNYEFLENKISQKRSIEIFGNQSIEIISKAAEKIKHKFISSRLEGTNKKKGTFITLGWKLELFNETKRKLSVSFDLSDRQKQEVLSGFNCPAKKRNSCVDGKIINESGIANYILIIPEDVEEISKKSAQCYLDEIISINDYAKKIEINGGFTALNYFPEAEKKWDGDRPLAVWINWTKKNKRLIPEIVFRKPFDTNGNKCADNLKKVLK